MSRRCLCRWPAAGSSATRCRRRLHRFMVVQLVRAVPQGMSFAQQVLTAFKVRCTSPLIRAFSATVASAPQRGLSICISPDTAGPVRRRQSFSQHQPCRCGCRCELPERASNEWFRNQWRSGFETILLRWARRAPASGAINGSSVFNETPLEIAVCIVIASYRIHHYAAGGDSRFHDKSVPRAANIANQRIAGSLLSKPNRRDQHDRLETDHEIKRGERRRWTGQGAFPGSEYCGCPADGGRGLTRWLWKHG
jgi:hypothetical protein